MEDANCPSCRQGNTTITDRTVVDAGLRVSYECDDCGHTWAVTF